MEFDSFSVADIGEQSVSAGSGACWAPCNTDSCVLLFASRRPRMPLTNRDRELQAADGNKNNDNQPVSASHG
jgi:hypothetical protein